MFQNVQIIPLLLVFDGDSMSPINYLTYPLLLAFDGVFLSPSNF